MKRRDVREKQTTKNCPNCRSVVSPTVRWFNKLKLPSRRPPGPDITRLFANPLLPSPILSHGGCEPDFSFSDCRCQSTFLTNFSMLKKRYFDLVKVEQKIKTSSKGMCFVLFLVCLSSSLSALSYGTNERWEPQTLQKIDQWLDGE